MGGAPGRACESESEGASPSSNVLHSERGGVNGLGPAVFLKLRTSLVE